MAKRKEIRAQAKNELKEYREKRKQKLSDMSIKQRFDKWKEERPVHKAASRDRKQALNAMPKAERREAKLHDKFYKKYKNRPVVLSVWGIVILVLILFIAPFVFSIAELLSVEIISGTPEANEVLAHGEDIAEKISDEALVLLKNQDDLLPLSNQKVNVFGFSSMNFRIGGGGSGGSDQTRSIDFYQGLENAGISYNPDLYSCYAGSADDNKEASTGLMQIAGMMLSGESSVEPPIDYLTDKMLENAREYSPVALILLTSSGMESSDFTPESLRLIPEQHDLIERVSQKFDNIVLIVNTGNTFELGFLEDYPAIKSVLWVGTPGPRGANSIGRTLSGELNPSGRLTDTYVYDNLSHPSTVNFGDFHYTDFDRLAFVNYDEGIYVGYRYFETRYQGDEKGYWNAVQFPFGYGLSYTDFAWELSDYRCDDDTISVDVKVTNKGNRAGKEVVQLYFSAPYTPGGIEKSAIELAAYGKTELLESGQSQILTLEFPVKDMASYDMNIEEAYILEKGNYLIKICRNVHDPVITLPYELEETVVYRTDEVTGTPYRNQFEFANGGHQSLSRNDWQGTYPDLSKNSYKAPQSLLDGINPAPSKVEGDLPTTGKDNGLMLADLKNLPYDDPLWESYLDQFTLKEMITLVSHGAYKTIALERLGLPESVLLDGPAGINFFFKPLTAASYPTAIVIGSTWNDELAWEMGDAVGQEARVYGVQGWYAPGMNVHRSPLNGRNFEYFSEDPLLSGKMAAGITRGAQHHKIMVFMKHFAIYQQEKNARSGLSAWVDEQAIREIYLRPFEITEKEADVTGAMSSFTVLGNKWIGGSPEMLQNVLRDEWGFDGLVTTDAVIGSHMDVNTAIRYGNELMLAVIPGGDKDLKKLYKEDPVGILEGLRDRTRTICYSILNYTALVE